MVTKNFVLHGRARELAKRYTSPGTDDRLANAIVQLVEQYLREEREKSEHPKRWIRPNCF